MGDLDLPALLADQLLHPLPGAVVEVVRVHRRLGTAVWVRKTPSVGVVPFEVARGRLLERKLPLAIEL